ncbi:DUF1178 family protein [Sphingosinicella humi]|uniref:DUF1178 domain-containing protein n=1 Tax=Allosphingosinicella humi TaxID=2068657 RepID=A0A2U2J5I9_9SPHN|nr:DUF1178 family protein [Sphingosinicella humi]PWG03599.1 DUF1178 domain-containing protein [Sphingosinicella humi]
MIVFDLKCASASHVFEGWFGSSDAFEDQRGRGLVECPVCGSREVEKAVMAPRVAPKGNRAEAPTEMLSSNPAAVKAMMAQMAEAQKKMLEGSDYVGDRFADEARAIHLGESEARSIHGRATREQTDSLLEDGIKVAPLPFPVLEPGREN